MATEGAQLMNLRNSPLPDEAIASLLGLADLRVGRHSPDSTDPMRSRDFWVQSIWRARILPVFHADAFLAVVTCAEPWQPGADPQPGVLARCMRLAGLRPKLQVVGWRKAVLSLQGDPTVIELPNDPVAAALREVDLFETHEYGSLDGIAYTIDVETWNIHASLAFANPEVPSLQRLAKAILAVGQEVGRASGREAVVQYLKVWAEYES